MATDTLDSFGQKLVPGNNFYLSIEADNKDEARKIFQRLSAGGTVTMPLHDTFWGYFGMINDKFGIRWMVNHMQSEHN
jgi:PhnB protein